MFSPHEIATFIFSFLAGFFFSSYHHRTHEISHIEFKEFLDDES